MTPVRALPLDEHDGCLLLGAAGGVTYLDGAEELVAAIVGEAADRSSLSDELHYAAKTWAEQYHLDRGRANVLRALDLPAGAAVLEIGAGCGAITRYLGERVALVDAVEPVAARARVAARRTADLPGVRVFAGTLDQVPVEPAYDLAVVVGVLEYVGAGAADDAPYVEFLRSLRARLKPGGALVLAIENQLGVKYLAGAPEDHSGRPWDGPQGYPDGGPARTFSRRRLLALLETAGFRVGRALGCFPDYKITRAVLSPELVERYPRLADELPSFPSPDWGSDAVRQADEARLWHEFAAAGLAAETWNSFLVLASADEPAAVLWPEDRLACYFNTDRAAAWCTRGEVLDGRVRRTPLRPQRDEVISIREYEEPVYEGVPLLTVLEAEPWRAAELLTAWRDMLAARLGELGAPAVWDLVPHNLVVTADGLCAIDLEWRVEGADLEWVEQRGLLLTADRLARSGWSGAGERTTVRDLAGWLGVLLGHPPSYVDEAAEREAHFQAARICGGWTGPGLRREREYLRAAWSTRLGEFVAG
ncbi:class I SAM-dependent methyltransferase [Saccharothrix variisporea]|uniref:Methyltransferase family protein n=1 Tax=Saccharothrix variisporea TaxID=543527 RepID=A0A495XBU7_9PSEU|nr:methyltransferase domain-containing protein [Saccharothrix variisporea]RKT71467.1 methyltransferase family protein [Saccharothrix variisporea]